MPGPSVPSEADFQQTPQDVENARLRGVVNNFDGPSSPVIAEIFEAVGEATERVGAGEDEKSDRSRVMPPKNATPYSC